MKTLALFAMAFLSGGMAVAAQVVPTQQQKLELVAKLLDTSPAVARINASGHDEAKAALGAARTLYAQAVEDLRIGKFSAVDRTLNEALVLIGRAQALVPDPVAVIAAQRTRYAQLIASVESVQASYLHHLPHTGGRPETDLRWLAVSHLVDSARNYARHNSFARANQLLVRAEVDLLVALESLLGRTTIEYANHFVGKQEEFTYELARNRSYSDLVPLAVTELKPAADAVRLVGQHLNAGLALRKQAEKMASQRDWNSALETIRRSTGELQGALLVAGLVVPKE